MVYPIVSRTIFPLARFFIKEVEGLENLPERGAYILACKHLGSLDGVFIASVVIPRINRKVHFFANVAPWGWFWEKIIAEKVAGCIPFPRENPVYRNNPKISLDIARKFLREGKIVGIFPEGFLQEIEKRKFRVTTGTARMALWEKAPIVPVGLECEISVKAGPSRLYKRRQAIKNILLNPHSLKIRIGQPFELVEFYNQPINKELLVKASQIIMDKIDSLSRIIYK